MTMLFCNIARMDSYRGCTAVDQPQGGGNYPNQEKEEVHNFHPYGDYVYGYVAAVSHSIRIEKLGAEDKTKRSVDNVDVIWTAPAPQDGLGRYVVGWYRDATIFRHLEEYERGYYHVKANKRDYVLLPPDKRELTIQQSSPNQTGGFGTSNVWYADSDYGQKICTRVTQLFGSAKRQVFDRGELEDLVDTIPPSPNAPEGVEKPSRSKREIAVIGRNPEVQRWILQCAGGRCELCGEPAPFNKPSGYPYLEIHHVHRLADGGADIPKNAVALCPNCHREAHHGTRTRVEVIRNQLSELASHHSL